MRTTQTLNPHSSWGIATGAALMLIGLGILSPLTSFAQTSSPEVFDRVEKNLKNAYANREDSQRNLEIINENLGQVFKAREKLTQESTKVKSELQSNQQTLAEIEKNLAQVTQFEEQEKKTLQTEEAKIAELEAALQKLKTSTANRKQNLTNSQNDREKLQMSQAEWKARGEGLQKLSLEAKIRNDKLDGEEKEWSTKKLSYEKDIERWNKLVNHQEKVKANLTALKAN